MAWFDDINAYKLIPITTGDGTTYELKMKFKGGSINPLTAVYNYAGKVGSKPTRNSSASPVYDLMFFVPQDSWKNFKDSISDPSSEWLVKHPLYGDLVGQPTSMNWDNTKFGDVEFNIQFQQSISDETPDVLIDYKSAVLTQSSLIDEATIVLYENIDPSTEELNIFDIFIDELESIYENVMNSDILNLFYDIRQVLIDTTFDSSRFISLNNQILNSAASLSVNGILSPLNERFNLISLQMAEILNLDEAVLTESADGNTSDAIALYKENCGAVNLGAMAIAISTPSESQNDVAGFDITDTLNAGNQEDYKYKKDVDKTIENTNILFNDYVSALDAIDIEIQGYIKYSPDDNLNYLTTNIVLNGIQSVKEISATAKTENIIITEKDTVPEILAFELYGSASDENINDIINNNDLLGINSIKKTRYGLVIKKGTSIIYYD